jgi:hypothetical protein
MWRIFWRSKTALQNTTFTTHPTTISPPKNTFKHPLFPKHPQKTPEIDKKTPVTTSKKITKKRDL